MTEEHFTISEAARYLKVSRQTLYTWLNREPALRAYLTEHHTLTRRQLDALALTQRRKPPQPTLREVDAALTERIEALERWRAEAEARLAALEGSRPSSAKGATTDVSVVGEGQQNRLSMRLEGKTGALMKSDAARLIAARHGVTFNTAKGWPWPPSALASEEAALRWALDYVARTPRQHPAGWRWRCDVPGCPCQESEKQR